MSLGVKMSGLLGPPYNSGYWENRISGWLEAFYGSKMASIVSLQSVGRLFFL